MVFEGPFQHNRINMFVLNLWQWYANLPQSILTTLRNSFLWHLFVHRLILKKANIINGCDEASPDQDSNNDSGNANYTSPCITHAPNQWFTLTINQIQTEWYSPKIRTLSTLHLTTMNWIARSILNKYTIMPSPFARLLSATGKHFR